MYIFGEQFAVVTSANLTMNALDSNIEVGVQLTGSAVAELNGWFETLWRKAQPLAVTQLASLQQETDPLRHEYRELRKKAGTRPTLPNEALPSGEPPADLRYLLDNAKRFFCCNSNRSQGTKTPTGYALEEEMHNKNYAAAWESPKANFLYKSHMERVERGDAIFVFAKHLGIVGVGRAKAKRQILEPSDPDRIGGPFETAREWRVPVDWLDWRDTATTAFRLRGRDIPLPSAATFYDVTGTGYTKLRAELKRHFLG